MVKENLHSKCTNILEQFTYSHLFAWLLSYQRYSLHAVYALCSMWTIKIKILINLFFLNKKKAQIVKQR